MRAADRNTTLAGRRGANLTTRIFTPQYGPIEHLLHTLTRKCYSISSWPFSEAPPASFTILNTRRSSCMLLALDSDTPSAHTPFSLYWHHEAQMHIRNLKNPLLYSDEACTFSKANMLRRKLRPDRLITSLGLSIAIIPILSTRPSCHM